MFLILTFGIPVLMVIAGAIPILMETRGALPPIGYVDQTGDLAPVAAVTVNGDTLQLTSFPDTDAARRALEAGDVAGYLVIPEDYVAAAGPGTTPSFHGERRPNAKLQEAMKAFMRQAMLPAASASTLARLNDPSHVTYVARETGERVDQGPALIIRIATPAFLALVFVLSVFASANQMGSAVVREKEQRAMEMVITSISPEQLVTGKVLGMTLLSLTQVALWTVGAVLAIAVALLGRQSIALRIQDLSIPWSALLWAGLLGIPAYFLYAVVGAGLGLIAGDKQQAQGLSGMLGILGMSPLYLLATLIENTDGALAVGLTLFPLTAPTIALFRMTFSEVPAWQLFASLGIILITLAAGLWFVARILRAAILLYGQSLQPREILRALRQT
jgi:ABC-2 type transport system permease protein